MAPPPSGPPPPRDFAAPSPIQAMKARSAEVGAAQPDEEAPYVLGVAASRAHCGVAGDGVAVPAEDHLSFLCARWSGRANDGPPTGRQGHRVFDQPVIGAAGAAVLGLAGRRSSGRRRRGLADQQLFEFSGVLRVVVLQLRVEFAGCAATHWIATIRVWVSGSWFTSEPAGFFSHWWRMALRTKLSNWPMRTSRYIGLAGMMVWGFCRRLL